MIFKPGTIRYISFIAAVILSMPLPLGILSGFYLWTSPFILLNSFLALKTVVLFSIFGFAVLALILYKDLWFCRYWCPTGVICDSVSNAVRKGNSKWKFPFIQKQLVVLSLTLALFGVPILLILDPINIFYNFFNVFNFDVSAANVLRISGLLCIVLLNILFPYSWCDRICPLRGLQLFITDAKRLFKTQKTIAGYNFSQSRRNAISGILGVGAALALREFSAGAAMPVFRPPGALPEHQYKTVCARCGNCIQACPVDIIKSSFGSVPTKV